MITVAKCKDVQRLPIHHFITRGSRLRAGFWLYCVRDLRRIWWERRVIAREVKCLEVYVIAAIAMIAEQGKPESPACILGREDVPRVGVIKIRGARGDVSLSN